MNQLTYIPKTNYRAGGKSLSRGKLVYDPERFEQTTQERVLIGRLTKRRYHLLRRIVASLQDRAPYGVSPNGYPYTCGCEGDCCGHICGVYAGMTITHYLGGFRITIGQTEARNY